ncbi:MAG: ATP-binding protein [Candidatus Obscuribacterales bacterium]
MIPIDEAQQIPNIGMGLKIIVDQVPGIQVIATGSASFDLVQHVGEPLTGRKQTIHLFPLAQMELHNGKSRYDLKRSLRETLIYGSYPDVLLAKSAKEKRALLQELVSSYLLKDILALERVKGSAVLFNLVKLLAFQVGQLVSLNELATQLGLDVKTIARYIDLLEKGFVIHRLGGYSRNLRSEITREAKYYFLDNGIRNGVIGRFDSLDNRDDQGALWENFLLAERVKWASYHGWYGSRYFWRTYDGQEIDFIEENEGELAAFEAKWSSTKGKKVPHAWISAYPQASYKVITPENYLDFVMEPMEER